MASSQTFGIGVAEAFGRGVRGFAKRPVHLSVAAAVVLGTYLAFRFPAQAAFDDGDIAASIGYDLAGLFLSSVVAVPWYSYALDVARDREIDVARPLVRMSRFKAQAVASFWFWAGVLLGLRYLFGLPSIIVVLFYAFFGFVVADDAAEGGLKALGTSVRLGEGRRMGLFALAGLLLLFNIVGAIAVGFEVTGLTIAIAAVGVIVTSSITMVTGAVIYLVLTESLGERR